MANGNTPHPPHSPASETPVIGNSKLQDKKTPITKNVSNDESQSKHKEKRIIKNIGVGFVADLVFWHHSMPVM